MIVESHPRRDLAAHARAVRAPFPQVVAKLRELLGARLVAYLGGVKATRAVADWAEGRREPGELDRARLRIALQVADMLAAEYGRDTAQAWFIGMNPELDDHSPARALREGDPAEIGRELVGAARSFLATG